MINAASNTTEHVQRFNDGLSQILSESQGFDVEVYFIQDGDVAHVWETSFTPNTALLDVVEAVSSAGVVETSLPVEYIVRSADSGGALLNGDFTPDCF